MPDEDTFFRIHPVFLLMKALEYMLKHIHNSEHYRWGQGCDGWHLLRTTELNVIQERMPEGTAEVWHYHQQSQQLFFILKGKARMETTEGDFVAQAGESIHIRAGLKHRIVNAGAEALDFLVISQPATQGDRINL